MNMSGGALQGAPPAFLPEVFGEHVHGADLGELTILLDLKRDVYLSAPTALIAHLAAGAPPTPQTEALRATLASKGLLATPLQVPCSRFLRACLWARRVLVSKRLDCAADALGALRRRNGCDRAPDPIAQAFEAMRPWYPRRRICLFDSLALLRLLVGFGAGGELVFGVRGMPFAAHCWVEHQGAPLNDEFAYCASFRQILRV